MDISGKSFASGTNFISSVTTETEGTGIIYILQQGLRVGCKYAATEYTLFCASGTSSSVCPESAVLANCKNLQQQLESS